jgi:hypothetical protein
MPVRAPAQAGTRTLVLVQGFPMGGYSAFNADLIPRLVAKGYAVTTAALEWWRSDWRLDRVRAVAPDVHHVPSVVPFAHIPSYVDHLIRSRDIEVVFLSHAFVGYRLLMQLRARFPHVAFVDYVHTEWFEAGMYGSYASMSAAWSSQLDAQIVSSAALGQSLAREGADAAKVQVAYIGIDAAEWTREGIDRDEIRGVMAHELAHVKNRDTLTMTVTATIAGAISALANFAFFFGGSREDDERPGGIIGAVALAILAPIAAMLVQMAISRSREYEADRVGAQIAGVEEALAIGRHQIAIETDDGVPWLFQHDRRAGSAAHDRPAGNLDVGQGPQAIVAHQATAGFGARDQPSFAVELKDADAGQDAGFAGFGHADGVAALTLRCAALFLDPGPCSAQRDAPAGAGLEHHGLFLTGRRQVVTHHKGDRGECQAQHGQHAQRPAGAQPAGAQDGEL